MSDRIDAARLGKMYAKCRGLTLLEVLIAVVILSIGLLGLAGLQTTSLKFNTSAYYRTQATAMAYGLADRMRANRQGALTDAYNAGFEDPPRACDDDQPSGGSPAEDIDAWRNLLACQLPDGTGAVTRRSGNEFTITVQWDDSRGEDDEPLQFEFTTGL